MSIESFHFLRPEWLWAGLGILPALWLFDRSRNAAGAWRRVCDPHLLAHLVVDGGGAARRWPLALFAVGWLATTLALAGPTWERLPQPAYKEPTQTVMLLDLSSEMRRSDVAPSRIARARYELLDLLERAEGAVGLVVFAEEPYAVTPLTDDPGVIAAQVPILSPDLMPGRGARVDRGIDRARELLTQAGAVHGRVVLVGTGLGDEPTETLAAAERAADAGFPVSVLGVGGNSRGLAEIASSGDGVFAEIAADDSDIERVLAVAAAPEGALTGLQASELQADVWRDMGAWLVWIPLLLAPLAFRRHWVGALALLVFVGTGPAPARAADAWFARADQQGADAFAAGDHAEAVELFEDPAWRGAAQYRAGDYAGAVETLASLSDPGSRYNLGNALAQSNQLEEALAAYDEVLEQDPQHADARHNRELVEKLLEQQKQQEQQQQNQQQQNEQQQSSDPSQQQNAEQEPQQQGSEQDAQPQQGSNSQGQDGSPQQSPSQDASPSEGSEGENADAGTSPQGASQPSEAAEDRPGNDAGSEENADPQPQHGQQPHHAGAEEQDEQQQAQTQPQPQHGQQPQPQAESRDGQGGSEDPARPEAGTPPPAASAQADPAGEPRPDAPDTPPVRGSGHALSEQDQEVEQWLNRVPDDPAGLLREKMRRRYAEKRYGTVRGAF